MAIFPERDDLPGTRRAYPIYLALAGLSRFFFALIFTVNLIYQFEVAHLNPLQLVLVGTLLESIAFLAEVPTGLVADAYSRRLSIIIGLVLIGAGFLLEGSVPTFPAILASQVFWGIGSTFTSGATEAWLADEVGELAAAPIYLRASQVSQVGALIGTFASVALASVRLNLPIVIGGGAFIGLAVVIALLMPEDGFRPTPTPERNSVQKLGSTFSAGATIVRASPVLLTILGTILFRGASSEAFDRLWQPHFVQDLTIPPLGQFKPIVWFGVISAAASLLSLGTTEFVRRRVDTTNHHAAARSLLVLNAILALGVAGVGLATNFWLAVVAYLIAAICRTTGGPIYTAWINQSLEPHSRATVLSIASQTDALGQVAGGPVLGWVGNTFSLRAAIAAASVLLLPALPLFARTLQRPEAEPLALAATGE
jgi:DHA3 family tetracycline resistance protein-like MFS transporter